MADNRTMINAGELKPILTALLMPPAGLLICAALGIVLAWPGRWRERWRRPGLGLALFSAVGLWLLSCHAVAVMLAGTILPQFRAIEPERLATLRAQGVQAVVVLGGGVLPLAPEYGQAQPASSTSARLRYGLKVARESGLALGFAGGVGWAAAGDDAHPSEASTAVRMASETMQVIRWLDAQSRDTAENAQRMRLLLKPEGIEKIALVTHAWHMPRSVSQFERVGFEVLPAPMGFVLPRSRPLLEWLPSTQGLQASQWVLREWLALRLNR